MDKQLQLLKNIASTVDNDLGWHSLSESIKNDYNDKENDLLDDLYGLRKKGYINFVNHEMRKNDSFNSDGCGSRTMPPHSSFKDWYCILSKEGSEKIKDDSEKIQVEKIQVEKNRHNSFIRLNQKKMLIVAVLGLIVTVLVGLITILK